MAGRSGLACDGPAITRGGPGPPWGDRVRGGYPRALQPSWGHGGPGPGIAQGGSGDHSPTCQGRAVCHVPRRQGGDYGLRDAKGLDTLAGGTPIRMYRQRPYPTPYVVRVSILVKSGSRIRGVVEVELDVDYSLVWTS
jgi:hypothetical protein